MMTPHIVVQAPLLGAPAGPGGSPTHLFDVHDTVRTSDDQSQPPPRDLLRPATSSEPLPLPYEANLKAAAGVAARHLRPLVVDIDRTIVHLDTPPDRELGTRALIRAVEAIAMTRRSFTARLGGDQAGIAHVFFVSNANRPLDAEAVQAAGFALGMRVHVVMRARKADPFNGPLAAHREELMGAVVYGDLLLTDGRLARALAGIWVQPPWAETTRDIRATWGKGGFWRGGWRHLNTVVEHRVGRTRYGRIFYRFL